MDDKQVRANTLTLVLIGIAAMVGYAKLGPIALIICGLILLMLEAK